MLLTLVSQKFSSGQSQAGSDDPFNAEREQVPGHSKARTKTILDTPAISPLTVLINAGEKNYYFEDASAGNYSVYLGNSKTQG